MQYGRARPEDGPIPAPSLRWAPPTSSWLDFQPRPIRLAVYVGVWAFVMMLVLAVFLPLAVAGFEKAVS